MYFFQSSFYIISSKLFRSIRCPRKKTIRGVLPQLIRQSSCSPSTTWLHTYSQVERWLLCIAIVHHRTQAHRPTTSCVFTGGYTYSTIQHHRALQSYYLWIFLLRQVLSFSCSFFSHKICCCCPKQNPEHSSSISDTKQQHQSTLYFAPLPFIQICYTRKWWSKFLIESIHRLSIGFKFLGFASTRTLSCKVSSQVRSSIGPTTVRIQFNFRLWWNG